MQVGQDVSAETVRQRLQGFAARPGWRELPAVQQGRLYAVYHGATRSIMDAALIEFMAKALYPDLFKDSRSPGHLSGLLPRLSAHSPPRHLHAGYQAG